MHCAIKCDKRVQLLRSMGISWIALITDGDSVLEHCNVPGFGWTTPLEFFLAHEIVPFVRDGTDHLPRAFTNQATVRKAASIYANYGLKPLWILRNEPFDGREWAGGWAGGVAPSQSRESMELISTIIQNRVDDKIKTNSGSNIVHFAARWDIQVAWDLQNRLSHTCPQVHHFGRPGAAHTR